MRQFIPRIETAIHAAPKFEGGLVPHVNKEGIAVPTISEFPNSMEQCDDYEPCDMNMGYEEPLNGVLVTREEYPGLFHAYKEFLGQTSGAVLTMDVAPIIHHEKMHGAVYDRLGAAQTLYGMRFGWNYNSTGGLDIFMTPYTVAADVSTFKLGAAAMLAAPTDPSEGDYAGIKNLGYTLDEVAEKVRAHNAAGRTPFIPVPASTYLP